MKFRRSARFKKSFEKLPKPVQEKAREAFALFKEQPVYPYHPSLVIKKIRGREQIWEGRVDLYYRFTFEILDEDGETVYFFRNIGGHDITSRDP